MSKGKVFRLTHPQFPDDSYIGCTKDTPEAFLKRYKFTCMDGNAHPDNKLHQAILKIKVKDFNKFEAEILEEPELSVMRKRKSELVNEHNPSWNKRNNKTADMKRYQSEWQREYYQRNKKVILERRATLRLNKKEKKRQELIKQQYEELKAKEEESEATSKELEEVGDNADPEVTSTEEGSTPDTEDSQPTCVNESKLG